MLYLFPFCNFRPPSRRLFTFSSLLPSATILPPSSNSNHVNRSLGRVLCSPFNSLCCNPSPSVESSFPRSVTLMRSPHKCSTLIPATAIHTGVQSPHSPQPSIETRRRLLSLLLTSLTPTSPSAPPLEKEQLDPTLSLIKLFGRAPAGSEELSREKALQTLLAYSGLARCGKLLRRPGGVGGFRSEQQRRRRGRSEDRPTGIVELVSSEDEEDLDEDEDSELNVTTPMPTRLNANSSDPLTHSESEALRTLCNVLMLHPSSRVAFPSALSNQDVRGLVRLVAVPGAGFLAGRLLFLLTSQQSEWVRELAEGSELVERMEEVRRFFSASFPVVFRRLKQKPLLLGITSTPVII